MTNPVLAETIKGLGRLYRDPRDAELVPSITNVIDVLAKPWLAGWAAKLVAGEAYDQRGALALLEDREQAVDLLKGAPYRKRNKAAAIGDTIHAYAESLHTDEPAPVIEAVHEPYIAALLEFIEQFHPVFEVTEGTVFSPMEPEHLRYGGTFDWLGTISGHRVLADWKTGTGVYDEVALQLAAGRRGEVVWDRQTGDLLPMPAVEACLAIHVRPDKFEVHVVDSGDEAFAAFLGLRQAWDWNKTHDGAIGPRMNPERLERELRRPDTLLEQLEMSVEEASSSEAVAAGGTAEVAEPGLDPASVEDADPVKPALRERADEKLAEPDPYAHKDPNESAPDDEHELKWPPMKPWKEGA